MRKIRSAGARLASAATTSRIPAVAANVTGSVSRTPHSILRRNRTATSDMPSPAPIPAMESRISGRITPAMVWRAVAPQRQPDPDLVPALRDGLRDQAVQADRRQQEGEARQNGKQRSEVALA